MKPIAPLFGESAELAEAFAIVGAAVPVGLVDEIAATLADHADDLTRAAAVMLRGAVFAGDAMPDQTAATFRTAIMAAAIN